MAAMEGWASFASADIWTDSIHGGGDPTTSIKYWVNGLNVVYLDNGHGSCADEYEDEDTNVPNDYADQCFYGDPYTWDNAPGVLECFGWDCRGIGAELDWMRMWWQYHTDTTNYIGSTVSHTTLQSDIEDALGWDKETFWEDHLAAVAANDEDRCERLLDVAHDVGASEPTAGDCD